MFVLDQTIVWGNLLRQMRTQTAEGSIHFWVQFLCCNMMPYWSHKKKSQNHRCLQITGCLQSHSGHKRIACVSSVQYLLCCKLLTVLICVAIDVSILGSDGVSDLTEINKVKAVVLWKFWSSSRSIQRWWCCVPSPQTSRLYMLRFRQACSVPPPGQGVSQWKDVNTVIGYFLSLWWSLQLPIICWYCWAIVVH